MTVNQAATVSGYSGAGLNRVDPANNPNDIGKILMPDVVGFYNTFNAVHGKQVISSVPNNSTLDFNTYPVIQVTGDADLGNVKAVLGSGTVIVSGGRERLAGVAAGVHIITLGSVN